MKCFMCNKNEADSYHAVASGVVIGFCMECRGNILKDKAKVLFDYKFSESKFKQTTI